MYSLNLKTSLSSNWEMTVDNKIRKVKLKGWKMKDNEYDLYRAFDIADYG